MKRLLPAVVFLMFWGSALHAAPVLFDTRADFNAAVGAHALFTDFAVTHIPGTFDFEGNFGGLQFRQEGVQLTWGNALGTSGVFAEGNGGNASLGAYTTRPVRAIGFDVLSARAATGPSPIGFPPVFPEIIPTNLTVAFSTLAGEQASQSVPPGAFLGRSCMTMPLLGWASRPRRDVRVTARS